MFCGSCRAMASNTPETYRHATPALGGYIYATKFVDQHTKWKEISLIKTKTQTIDALELFNKALVVPQRTRLIRLRADKGTEFTSSAFRQYWLDVGLS